MRKINWLNLYIKYLNTECNSLPGSAISYQNYNFPRAFALWEKNLLKTLKRRAILFKFVPTNSHISRNEGTAKFLVIKTYSKFPYNRPCLVSIIWKCTCGKKVEYENSRIHFKIVYIVYCYVFREERLPINHNRYIQCLHYRTCQIVTTFETVLILSFMFLSVYVYQYWIFSNLFLSRSLNRF